MPMVFGLGTGVPIMLIAWLVSYSAVNIGHLTSKMGAFEKWFRHICAVLFLVLGVYLTIHCVIEYHEHNHNGCNHCELRIDN